MSTIGQRIREERKRLGYNQEDFASLAGVGRRTQVNYESSQRVPDLSYLEAIVAAGADSQYILTGERAGVGCLVQEEPAEHGDTPKERASAALSLAVDAMHELGLDLDSAQLKALVGYAYETGADKEALKEFIRVAFAVSGVSVNDPSEEG